MQQKIVKYALFSLGAVVLIISAVAFFLIIHTDNEVIKDKITTAVYTATGKKLEITGGISLQFFPAPGIKIKNVTLLPTEKFNPNKFITLKSLEVSIKLLPLIKGQVIVDSLELDGLDLYLIENVSSKSNWQNSPPPKHQTSTDATNSKTKISITKLQITNSNLLWHNQKLNKKIQLSQVELTGHLHDDQTAILEFGFSCYQGKGSGTIQADFKTPHPQFAIKIAIENVQAKQLLMDLANQSKLNGTINIQTNLAMSGLSEHDILNTLSGKGDLTIDQGSYQGVDIAYELERAYQLISLRSSSAAPKPKNPHTDFSHLNMNYTINHGILNAANILIRDTDYHITGSGTANLSRKSLNFAFKAYTKQSADFFIPINITGSFSSPAVHPDAAVIVNQALKNIIQKSLPEQLKEIGKHLDIDKILPLDKIFN